MVHASAAGPGVDSSKKQATALSIALHGVVVWLVIAFAGKHPLPAPLPPPIGLTNVEVVTEAPAALPAATTPPVSHKAGPRTGAGVHGQRAAVQRAEPVAPAPRTVQSLADVQVHDEDKTQFVDRAPAKLADVTSGIGLQGVGAAGIDLPDAQGGGSRARGPKPKYDYTNLHITGASKFAGMTVKLRLSIDVHGKVKAVQVLQGVDPEIDHRTIAMVRRFEYEPARADDGTPIAGTQRWNFEVVDDDGTN